MLPSDQHPPAASQKGVKSRARSRSPVFRAGRVICGLTLVVVMLLVWRGREWAAAGPKWQARRALAARDTPRAMAWLEWARRMAPADPELEFLSARAARKEGRLDAVRTHLKRAWELGLPADRIRREECLALAQGGQLSRAEPHLPGLLQDPQGDAVEICEAFVNGYFRAYRMGDALKLLEAWIADYPQDPQPYYLRGRIRAHLHQSKQAEQDFRRTLELAPAHAEAAFELANVLLEQKSPEEALQFYGLGTASAEHATQARIGQVECLRMLARPEQARAILAELLAAQPDLTEGLHELGQLDLETGRLKDALRNLKSAYARSPRDLEIRYALATALRGTGKVAEAQAHFQGVNEAHAALTKAADLTDAVGRNPNDVAARYRIGMIFLQYGSVEKGAVWLMSVLDRAPHHRATHEALAAHYAARAAKEPRFAALAERHRAAALRAQEAPKSESESRF